MFVRIYLIDALSKFVLPRTEYKNCEPEQEHDDLIMGQETTPAQLNDPCTHWETLNLENHFEGFHELRVLVLVMNGNIDIFRNFGAYCE